MKYRYNREVLKDKFTLASLNEFSKLQSNSFFETNLLPESPQTLQAPSFTFYH